MCNCHSILECCVMFSAVKLSIRSFNLLLLLLLLLLQWADEHIRKDVCRLN